MDNAPILRNTEQPKKERKSNKFVRFMKAVFVHNFGYKVLAVALSCLLWVLAVGLSGLV